MGFGGGSGLAGCDPSLCRRTGRRILQVRLQGLLRLISLQRHTEDQALGYKILCMQLLEILEQLVPCVFSTYTNQITAS